jgi:hypothetical protein
MITADDFAEATRGISFDPVTHRYASGAIELPSVTGILKRTGVSLDFEQLVVDGKLTAEELEDKRARGQAAHAAAHYYDEGTLKAGTVDERVQPYLEAWIAFRTETGFTPALFETPLWHPGFLFAGTLDRAGTFTHFDGARPRDLHTVDIKLGDPDDAAAQWQTAAYANLLAINLSPRSPWYSPLIAALPTYSVQLLPTGRYKLSRYDNTLVSYGEFVGFLTTFRRQHARRQKAVAA